VKFNATAGGNRAHRILDWAEDGAQVYVKTPRFGWHAATNRERVLLGYPPRYYPASLRRKRKPLPG
jgi:hypothetical protein